MLDTDNIFDRANRCLGRATNLKDSEDPFHLEMLLGEPRNEKLRIAYAKALNILHKMPVKMDFVSEQLAGKFSTDLAEAMGTHPPV